MTGANTELKVPTKANTLEEKQLERWNMGPTHSGRPLKSALNWQ